MTSKLKTDILETGSGSGTIALNNQLSGMTSASVPSGSVLQVVSTTLTNTLVYTAANTYTDISGLVATITPTSTSSKILITCSVALVNNSSNVYVSLKRDSSFVGVGPADGSRARVAGGNTYYSSGNGLLSTSFQYLDSPSTVGATTYQVQSITDSNAATYINRTSNDANAIYGVRSQSTITLTEIKG